MQIIDSLFTASFACPLCSRPMVQVDETRVACQSDKCKLKSVKYWLPAVELRRATDQSEPEKETPKIAEHTRPERNKGKTR